MVARSSACCGTDGVRAAPPEEEMLEVLHTLALTGERDDCIDTEVFEAIERGTLPGGPGGQAGSQRRVLPSPGASGSG